MSVHVPVHHAGLAGHHVYRNALLAVGAAILVFVMGMILMIPRSITTTPTFTEAQSIVQFRAGERDDWAAGLTTESQSLIQFRAGERAMP